MSYSPEIRRSMAKVQSMLVKFYEVSDNSYKAGAEKYDISII